MPAAEHDDLQSTGVSALPAISPSSKRAAESHYSTGTGFFGRTASEPVLARTASSLASTRPASFKSFVERQLSHPSVTARRNFATRYKTLVLDRHADESSTFLGAKGAEGFRTHLKLTYGSVLAGWRILDKDGYGRLSFQHFCSACRRMGYHGNLKLLWADLDKSSSGFVSIMEIDPEVGHYVITFKTQLRDKYGDILAAWKKSLDKRGRGYIEEEQVAECLQELGLDLNAKKLYEMLRVCKATVGISLRDFDPRSYRKFLTSKSTEPGDGASEGQEKGDDNPHVSFGLQTAGDLKKALTDRFGSIFVAWRSVLDPHDNGRLTFVEFCKVLRQLGYHGDYQGLFRQLDPLENGYLQLQSLDPDIGEAWSNLRDLFKEDYGNMLLAWLKGVDVKGFGRVDEREFIKSCKKVGFRGDAGRIFHLLKPDTSRKLMSLEDFDIRAFRAYASSDFRMLTEPKSGAPLPEGDAPYSVPPQVPLKDMTFDERMQSTFFFQMRRSRNEARRTFAKALRVYEPPEEMFEIKEQFKHLCVRKYGSLAAAWKSCLDVNGSGKLTFNELCAACRRLGYTGRLRNLWVDFGCEQTGSLSFKELDPNTHEALQEFFFLIHDRFSDLPSIWTELFAKDPHLSIDRSNLAKACEVLRIPPDNVDCIFSCLQVEGRTSITMWDFETVFVYTRNDWELSKLGSTRRKVVPLAGSQRVEVSSLRPSSSQLGTTTSEALLSTDAGAKPLDLKSLTPRVLRQALAREFGTTVNAWITEFDKRGRGFVNFGQFTPVLERCAVHGNVLKLWSDLTGDRGMLRFSDLDPDAQRFIKECRDELLGQYGHLKNAWYRGFDAGGLGHLDLKDFLKACRGEVLPALKEKSATKLFNFLLSRQGQRSVRIEDLRPLLLGLNEVERRKAWDNDAPPPPPPPLPQTGPEEADVGIRNLNEFKAALAAQHGSLFAAFRNVLDYDRNGLVSYRDFSEACRSLGVKRVPGIWKELNRRNAHAVSLEDFDPETAEVLTEFQSLLLKVARPKMDVTAARPLNSETGDPTSPSRTLSPNERSAGGLTGGAIPTPKTAPSLKDAWMRIFDPQRIYRVDRQRFVDGCRLLGYSQDPERLFALLKPTLLRDYLVFEDIFVDLNPNRFTVKPNVKATILPVKLKEDDLFSSTSAFFSPATSWEPSFHDAKGVQGV